MVKRIPKEEDTIPERIDNYYYYTKLTENNNFIKYCRKKNDLLNEEEIILDQNEESKKYSFIGIKTVKISEDHRKMLYIMDTTGTEVHKLYIKNLDTNKMHKVNFSPKFINFSASIKIQINLIID